MNESTPSRRTFIKGAALAGAAAAPYIAPSRAFSNEAMPLKVGLIGAGGRGSGALMQSLTASKYNTLHAIGEVVDLNTLKRKRDNFKKSKDAQVDVPDERLFTGLDAYKKVIESGVDLVILTTPPGFRPQHLAAAVDAGKHVFCEKPMAVDPVGIRSVLASARKAKEKKLSVTSGFCWRYNYPRREAFKRVHDGEIGDIVSYQATYLTGPVKPLKGGTTPEDYATVEQQVKHWYNFGWLSGDSVAEQAVHSVDKINWAMKDVPPVECWASGGRQVPSPAGNIYDHFAVTYIYANGVRCFLDCRQMSNCHGENNDYVMGSKGIMTIAGGPQIRAGEHKWRYKGDDPNMYQVEHNEMNIALRKGEPINDGEWMATSSLMGIMGRMAAYTGKKITWDQVMKSKLDLAPDTLKWDDKFDPGSWAVPGKTRLV